jgi:site-specific DNA recombinase
VVKAVVYARYSSDNQREESITAQVRACEEYARRNGYKLLKVYADEAKTALTDDRPNFLRMIRDARAGLFDVVLVHKMDRFARNRYDSAVYKRELRRAGVRVESVLEPLDDSPESIILESVLEGLAEYYSRNLAREVMKGMKENALQCKHNGGIPPLGYDVDPQTKKLVVNESEAKVVRLIFEMYAQGKSYNAIIAALNERGYRTKTGRPFGKNSIHDLLINKKYIGIYTFNRSVSKSEGRRNHHRSKDPREIIEIPGGVPAIVDEGLFWRVQERMKQNKRAPGQAKAKVVYLLSGLIWCGECGFRMVGNSSSYHAKGDGVRRQTYYYTCNFGDRTGGCDNGKVRKELIEEYVLNELGAKIFNEETILVLARKLYQLYLEQKTGSKEECRHIERELAETEKRINNLVAALAAGGVAVQAIVEQLKSLETKKAAMEVQLQELRMREQEDVVTEEAIAAYLRENMRLLKSKDPDTCRWLIGEFVERVTVTRENVDVIFKVTVDLNGGGKAYRIKSTVPTKMVRKK